ncbi:MAG: prephenate dehydrogenase/arogenate dehydrogenase family protein [Halieaceae bacterium]|jgi:3-phosphoshikimate 1-carboxyvinyltransferase|nr:prephenate dehydrogenase/arogenate dehydrogenase family protein [Halieaceae bacterium]
MSEQTSAPRVGIVGLGLIGGSLALALRDAGSAGAVLAWDPADAVLEAGLQGGVIDTAAASLEALLDGVDVVVLAAPTVACAGLLERILARGGAYHCVTDVASVKGPLVEAAARLGAAARRFVPGHPIAGSERSGVGAARADLFRDHRVILTPDAATDAEALGVVRALWRSAGAEVTTMGVEEHDAVLAATSHLPHVLAFALVDALARAPSRDDIFRYAAGGFRDFTRIASSDPVMWRDVALANRDALLAALDDFTARLAVLRTAIEGGDGDALEATFRNAKRARDAYAGTAPGPVAGHNALEATGLTATRGE